MQKRYNICLIFFKFFCFFCACKLITIRKCLRHTYKLKNLKSIKINNIVKDLIIFNKKEKNMTRMQTVWNYFSGLIYRQFGCHVELTHCLDEAQSSSNEILDIIMNYKNARLIVMQNDLFLPIVKNDHLYGYICVVEGIKLQSNQVDKISILMDLLIRSVIIAEHKKQTLDHIEISLKKQIKKEVDYIQPKLLNVFPFPSTMSFNPKYPVFILAHNPQAAIKKAYNIHTQSQSLQFLSVDRSNQDRLHYPKFISYLGQVTIYIPEITQLPLNIQKSLEKYFQSIYSYTGLCLPRIVAATTKDISNLSKIQKLIDQQIIYKPLLCHLAQSRITLLESDQKSCSSNDIQKFIRYLFCKEDIMKNVRFI